MYLAGGQLFSGPNLKDFLDGLLRQADAAVTALTAVDFAARGEAALEAMLVARWRVPETHLVAEDSYFIEERDVTVAEIDLPSVGLPTEGGTPLPSDALLKSVTIAIPFRGSPALFTHRPNVFSAHQPEAMVVGEELHVRFIVAAEEEWMIQHRFQQHIALIERSLEVTQWQAMEFNGALADAIRSHLSARKAALGLGS